jgi:hypothetical protein
MARRKLLRNSETSRPLLTPELTSVNQLNHLENARHSLVTHTTSYRASEAAGVDSRE